MTVNYKILFHKIDLDLPCAQSHPVTDWRFLRVALLLGFRFSQTVLVGNATVSRWWVPWAMRN